jgi:hypothetical protein
MTGWNEYYFIVRVSPEELERMPPTVRPHYRVAEYCFGRSNGGKERAEQIAAELGHHVEGPRACRYPGCSCGPTIGGPCALCYE